MEIKSFKAEMDGELFIVHALDGEGRGASYTIDVALHLKRFDNDDVNDAYTSCLREALFEIAEMKVEMDTKLRGN